MRRREQSSTPFRVFLAIPVVLSVVVGGVSDVSAIKWESEKSCPNYSASRRGKTPEKKLHKVSYSLYSDSPFVHVGHEMALFLKAPKGRLPKGGGFSTEPDGNVVEIVMMPPGGDPIFFPPLALTAVSPTALYVPFPDSREFLGRLVVGQMVVTVHTPTWSYPRVKLAGDPPVRVYPKPSRFVALPPANDVRALVEDGAELELLATVAFERVNGAVWIPLQFSGFGEGPPMPTCPGALIPKTGMTVSLAMRGADGASIPYTTLERLRSAEIFLGDFLLDGMNWYGYEVRRTSLGIPGLREGRVALCAMNDTMDAVMKLDLSRGSVSKGSRLRPLIRDGSPLRIKLEDIAVDPNPGGKLLKQDSFGSRCVVQ
jgi:hypothetical protein